MLWLPQPPLPCILAFPCTFSDNSKLHFSRVSGYLYPPRPLLLMTTMARPQTPLCLVVRHFEPCVYPQLHVTKWSTVARQKCSVGLLLLFLPRATTGTIPIQVRRFMWEQQEEFCMYARLTRPWLECECIKCQKYVDSN